MRWWWTLGVLVFFTAPPAEAQAPMSVVDATERALARYPSVAAAAARVDESRAAVREARAAQRPTVQVRATATQYEQDMLVSPIHGFQPGLTPPFDPTLFQTVVTASYPLYDGAFRSSRVLQTERMSEGATQAATTVVHLVAAQVVTSYGRVLSRSQVLRAHDQRIRALDAEQQRATRLFETGRAARLDVLRANAALASAAAERVSLAEALDTAERELARLIDGSVDEARADRLVPFGLADPAGRDRAALADAARQASPAIQEARLRVDAADVAIALVESERRPRLDVVGNVINFGSAHGQFSTEWNAGVQLAHSIFNGGATTQRLARARAARAAEAAQVRVAELRVDAEVDRALSAAAEAAARSESLSVAEARFAEVARIEQLRLDTGPGVQTDYLRAEADLLAARASLAEVAYGTLAARIELARVMGELDVDWLRRHVVVKP